MSEVIELAARADGLDVDVAKPADPFPAEDERPCWRCYDTTIERNGKKARAGVYWHGIKQAKGDSPVTLTDTWYCGPLHVEALTASQEDAEHGRLLRYRSATGHWKRWAMPMHMLAGDGTEVLGVLLGEGLVLDRRNKPGILDYINALIPRQRLRAATTTGWHGAAFVLPDEVIGADDIWYQATERTAPYGTAGNMDGWRDVVAARAVGNPLLTLGLSAAFAGVLLERLNIDGAGLHLFGDSSTGKTSILAASISVWGGPVFRRTWRTTSNGLEGAAKMHTGTLLALDEVGEVSPRDLYESAYALCNGHGKTRANIRGEARQVSRWRVFVLSTGEVTISSRMAAGGFEAKAGQALRLLDVPVTGAYGAWDELHGFASGAGLSDAIRDGAAQHYGHAGRAFVQALIEVMADGGDLAPRLQAIVTKFGAAGGQETRAARIFSLCALAGELATQAGIVPWKSGQAAQAALYCFGLWRNHRGTDGRNAEDAAILRAVADFIDKHGDSRFSGLDDHEAQTVRDRAGYWKDGGDGRLYLFTSGGLKDATKGYDLGRVLDALDVAGAIPERDTGKRSKKARAAGGRPVSLYHIDPEKLGGGR
ncbi:MAG: DUF927 domain-containing protein [Castellaniella sp.]|nr:DUF927 domain-containing protein [Castellaniella sp.]